MKWKVSLDFFSKLKNLFSKSAHINTYQTDLIDFNRKIALYYIYFRPGIQIEDQINIQTITEFQTHYLLDTKLGMMLFFLNCLLMWLIHADFRLSNIAC